MRRRQVVATQQTFCSGPICGFGWKRENVTIHCYSSQNIITWNDSIERVEMYSIWRPFVQSVRHYKQFRALALSLSPPPLMPCTNSLLLHFASVHPPPPRTFSVITSALTLAPPNRLTQIIAVRSNTIANARNNPEIDET